MAPFEKFLLHGLGNFLSLAKYVERREFA